MITEDTEIVTILAGEGGSVEQAEALTAKLVERYPDLEFEIHQRRPTCLSISILSRIRT